MTETIFKILAAIAPAIILAIIMLRKDRRPEPIGWLLAAVGLGVLAGPAVLLINLIALPEISTDTFLGALTSSFVNAAIPEECVKFLALWFLARRCRHFDEMFDGIVYAVCIGMGFAGLENVLYVAGAEGDWIIVGISRALMSVPMHYFFAIIMGTFFSLGWFDEKNRTLFMSTALAVPILVHGLYDTFCFTLGLSEDFCGYILVAFLLGFKYIRRYVRSLTDSMLRLDGWQP